MNSKQCSNHQPIEPIVWIRDLHKTYISKERTGVFGGKRRAIQALKGVSLDIYPGEIFGLLGPNGAGKTTLIKCLTTLLLPTSGTIQVNGYDVERDEDRVRASIGCMLMGERGLYWKLTGRENLDFFGSLYHIPPEVRRLRIQAIIELSNLGDIIDRTVETYSSGQKMKLAFAKALINQAPILVLDAGAAEHRARPEPAGTHGDLHHPSDGRGGGTVQPGGHH